MRTSKQRSADIHKAIGKIQVGFKVPDKKLKAVRSERNKKKIILIAAVRKVTKAYAENRTAKNQIIKDAAQEFNVRPQTLIDIGEWSFELTPPGTLKKIREDKLKELSNPYPE